MYRYRSTAARYGNHTNDGCPFCSPDKSRIIEEGKTALVIRNIFPYDLWESRKTKDHLMVVPKRHRPTLHSLTTPERNEIMAFIAKYEKNGYNIYARAESSTQKSIPDHQHSHLIATESKPAHMLFYWRKPYFLFHK